jgi:AcrR family transcriptional regulator
LAFKRSVYLNVRSTGAPGAETRDRILDAAARLFHEHGYADTGIATVLQAAGVNSGSLYHFFPGKEALLVGVLERHLGDLRPRILAQVEAVTEAPLGRLDALLDLYRRDLLMNGCTRGCPVGNLALEVGDAIPAARALIERYFTFVSGAIEGWLEGAGPLLPADLDRSGLATHALSALQGGLMQARAAGDIAPYDATVAQLRSLLDLLQKQARQQQEVSETSGEADEARNGLELPEWRTW